MQNHTHTDTPSIGLSTYTHNRTLPLMTACSECLTDDLFPYFSHWAMQPITTLNCQTVFNVILKVVAWGLNAPIVSHKANHHQFIIAVFVLDKYHVQCAFGKQIFLDKNTHTNTHIYIYYVR